MRGLAVGGAVGSSVLAIVLGIVGVGEASGREPFVGIALTVVAGSLWVGAVLLFLGIAAGWFPRVAPRPGSLRAQLAELERLQSGP